MQTDPHAGTPVPTTGEAHGTPPPTREPHHVHVHVPLHPNHEPHEPHDPHEPHYDAMTMSFAPSFVDMPHHVRDLVRKIRGLHAEELLAVVESVSRHAHRSVYSLADYRSETWLFPHVEPVKPTKPRWGNFKCDVQRGLLLSVSVWGIRYRINVVGLVLRLGLIFLLYLAIWTILPRGIVESGGVVFDPVVIVVLSMVVGSFFARLLQIPALIGVMWIAIMWNNVPFAQRFTDGIVPEVRTVCGRLGLTLILSRAGYALSVPALRQIVWNSIALGLLPAAVESVVHAALAQHFFFEGVWLWAFIESLICSIVSAAVVVPGVLLLREQGYGLGGGPLTLALTSVGIDTVAGIWAANFAIDLQFSDQSIGFLLGMIPVQILGGAIIGIVLGVVFCGIVELLRREAKKLPNGKYKKEHATSVDYLAIVYFMATVISGVFLGARISLAGGGAVLALMFSATVSHILSVSEDEELQDHKAALAANLADIWDLIVMPLVFSMLGSSIILSNVFNSTFFPYGFAIVVTSTFTRFCVALLCTAGMTMPIPQRTLLGLAWLGRAASQAALGGVPLTRARDQLAAAPPGSNTTALEQAVDFGLTVQNVSVLYIIFCAPIAALSIVKLGPRVLQRFDTRTGLPIEPHHDGANSTAVQSHADSHHTDSHHADTRHTDSHRAVGRPTQAAAGGQGTIQ